MKMVLAAAVSAVLLAGCTAEAEDDPGGEPGDGDVVQLGAPGESNKPLTDDEAEALAEDLELQHSAADVQFVNDMLAHHEQALVMTAMIGTRTDSRDLALLGERMDVSQNDEIAQMQAWLVARGEEVPAYDAHAHGAGHAAMPGMLSAEQLDAMRDASGEEFERLFLQGMIGHHQGAIVMVQQLFGSPGGGQDREMSQLANHIASDQAIEVARMQKMLKALDI